MKVTVSKDSLRRLLHKQRLPKKFSMYVAGCWLFDILKANNLSVHLWQMTYWVRVTHVNAQSSSVSWKGE